MLKRLTSGRIVLLWNRRFPEGKDEYPLSGGDCISSSTPASNHREELSISFSEDECASWSAPVVLARNPGGRLSYPYAFEFEPAFSGSRLTKATCVSAYGRKIRRLTKLLGLYWSLRVSYSILLRDSDFAFRYSSFRSYPP